MTLGSHFLTGAVERGRGRLLGDLHADLSADPIDSIVPDYSVTPYEQNVWATPEPLNTSYSPACGSHPYRPGQWGRFDIEFQRQSDE